MENLQEELTIASATIEEWTHRKTKKEGLKVNFTVSAPLPRGLAEMLKCGGIYDSDTGRIDLLHKLKDTELVIPVPGVEGGFASFFPDLLYCFKAKRDEQQFTLEFSVHISTRAEELHEIFKGTPDSIDLSVRPRQGQLFEGGTRVTNPVEKPERPDLDTGCIACNNEIPMADGSDTTHASGQMCTRNEDAAEGEAVLAPAAVMGGTHQRKVRTPRADRGTVN